MANKLKTTLLIHMLQRIQEKGQTFYLTMIGDSPDVVPYTYELLEIFQDEKAYWLHCNGYYVSKGCRKPGLNISTNELYVNLNNIVSIWPAGKGSVKISG